MLEPANTAVETWPSGLPSHGGARRRFRRSQASAEAARELEHAREMLGQIERILGLAPVGGTVAQDLERFVAILRGYVLLTRQTLAKGVPVAQGDLAAIRLTNQRAWTLTNQLLAQGLDDAILATLDVNRTVSALIPMLRTAVPKRISVECEAHSRPLIVRGLPVHLDRMLINLVLNARDAIQGRGTIRISTSHGAFHNGNPAAVIKVADTGLGMSQGALERIGEPFSTSKERDPALDLGLASVKALLKGLRGLLRVETRPGLGTTFSVLLPILPETLR